MSLERTTRTFLKMTERPPELQAQDTTTGCSRETRAHYTVYFVLVLLELVRERKDQTGQVSESGSGEYLIYVIRGKC